MCASPLPGPSGNVEYFLHLVADEAKTQPGQAELETMIDKVIKEGPQ